MYASGSYREPFFRAKQEASALHSKTHQHFIGGNTSFVENQVRGNEEPINLPLVDRLEEKGKYV